MPRPPAPGSPRPHGGTPRWRELRRLQGTPLLASAGGGVGPAAPHARFPREGRGAGSGLGDRPGLREGVSVRPQESGVQWGSHTTHTGPRGVSAGSHTLGRWG